MHISTKQKKISSSAMLFLNKVKPKTKNENIKLEKRKAIAYWGIKDYSNAEKSVLFVLKEQPNEEAFKKFYEGIKSVQAGVSTEELEAIF
ncbi:MAG: hypothetical protein HC905_00155 [Bacteroidales bacterium]|nr:hypothetical protein [Bacteroidales bacterium]